MKAEHLSADALRTLVFDERDNPNYSEFFAHSLSCPRCRHRVEKERQRNPLIGLSKSDPDFWRMAAEVAAEYARAPRKWSRADRFAGSILQRMANLRYSLSSEHLLLDTVARWIARAARRRGGSRSASRLPFRVGVDAKTMLRLYDLQQQLNLCVDPLIVTSKDVTAIVEGSAPFACDVLLISYESTGLPEVLPEIPACPLLVYAGDDPLPREEFREFGPYRALAREDVPLLGQIALNAIEDVAKLNATAVRSQDSPQFLAAGW